MLILHPAELTLPEINQMNREELIEQLLAFNEYCAFQLYRHELEDETNHELRNLLHAARRHYRGKGY